MARVKPDERKDGSIAYRVYFRHMGRQTTLTFDDENSAEVFKTAVNQLGAARALEMHRIEWEPRSPQSALTVEQYVRQHIDQLTGLEQYSIDVYERYLANDIGPFLGHIPLAALTEEDIASWVKHLETDVRAKTKKVLAPKTIANMHGFLSGALAAAVPKLIPGNPAAGRTLPRKTGDNDDDDEATEMRMLSTDEFDLLLDSTTDYWQPMVEFMVVSGARWGEIAAFKPRDVDRDAGLVRVRRAWKYSPSKGYYIGPPKTKRSKRPIDIDTEILNKLDYSNEYLFSNRAGGPVRYQGFRRRVWDKAVARAKLQPAPTPHDLRHTCASWMLADGVPLTVVSRHLGHESIKVTVDIYGDVDRTSGRTAASAMSKRLAARHAR